MPLALLAVLSLTLLVLGGLQRSNLANTVVVGLTLLSLLVFVLAGLPQLSVANLTPFFSTATGQPVGLAALLQASALLFVAYTGYGRIATLGEEVHAPRQTIPRAMLITLLLTMLLYVSVATVGIGVMGAGGLQAAPLAVAAAAFKIPGVALIVSLGAVTAMLGVVLNLILGLSRVLMAMGRRRDMPTALARLNAAGSSPPLAVIAVGLLIAALVLTGNIQTTWSFSAFNVLIYYDLTNLAALRLPPAERLYPRWMAWLGLLSCSSLAFWVETHIWLLGLALIAAGLLWQQLARQRWPHDSTSDNMS